MKTFHAHVTFDLEITAINREQAENRLQDAKRELARAMTRLRLVAPVSFAISNLVYSIRNVEDGS